MSAENSQLLMSIENGDLSGLIFALENGEDIEFRDTNGQTALILAAEKGSYRIVRELLDRNANVNARDEDGWTALIASCKEGFPDIVAMLLEKGAKHNIADMGGWTPLVWASYKGNCQVVKELLQYGADPNERGQHNMTALIWAAGRGHTSVVKELLDGGARAEIADKYGTTALIWACRKGHLEVAQLLVAKGADVNSVGTHGWTPLIMASKGGFVDVLNVILEKQSNVNLVDQDGRSALTWASKGGHEATVRALLDHGVYLNMPDKHGDTPLILAAKEGHPGVVKALLSKYADLELTDIDGKTALYQAVEKGHVECVRELLAAGASTEVTNKDEETPLLRGARKKHTQCIKLLLEKGADPSATDKKGDTALHIAVRSRYAGLCEVILKDQKHSRLLYKPNKAGETPYSIDRASKQSVLSAVFGNRELLADIDRMELPPGQDSFVMALADFIGDPSLATPLTVGLYSRWGAGKSVISHRIQDQLKAYAFQEAVVLFRITAGVVWTAISITITVGLIAWAIATWVEGLLVALATLVILIGLFILARSATRGHGGNINRCGLKLLRLFERTILFFKLLFCVPPSVESVRSLLPVHFVVVDLSNSSIFGDNPLTSLVNLSHEFNDAIERDLGIFIPRLYRVFRSGPYRARSISHMNLKSRWKKSCCCIPSVLFSVIVIVALWTGLFCLASFENNKGKIVLGIEIGSACVVGSAVLCNIPRFFVIIYCLVLSMKKRIMIVSSQPGIRDETFMHVLKQEIDLQADMLECIDGFTRRQTRVVLFIDLLESLEQQKVLHFVNSINALLSEAGHPFVSLISVDPRLLLKAIDQNLASLQDAHISPYDYFKNTVDLPCYFAEQRRPSSGGVLPREVVSTLSDIGIPEEPELRANQELEWDGAVIEHNNDNEDDSPRASCNGRVPLIVDRISSARHVSQESLNYHDDRGDRQISSVQNDDKDNVANDLSKFLRDSDSGSLADIKRIMNIVSLTGRLLHARNIPFRWRTLASWVSLADAWPYKVAWLIIIAEDSSVNLPSDIPLRDIYSITGSYMSMLGDPDMALDADIVYFETYLSGHLPPLTVGDIRMFLPCTFHIDPSIRKSMMEYLQAIKNGTVSKIQLTSSITETSHHIGSPSSSRFMWRSVAEDAVLSQLTSDDIVKQICEIDGIHSEHVALYQMQLKDHNINGKVLVACDLNELRDAMQMAFGDWQLFKTWILTARAREQAVSPRINMGDISFQSHSQPESTVEGSRTDSNSEIPNSPGTSRGIRGISSGSEHASVHMQDFDDTVQNFPVRGSSRGPYGSHPVRQVIPRVPNAQGKQEKQESIDSVKSFKSSKDLAPIIEPTMCSNCESCNYSNNIRHANHLQRSADSGFASTEVDANQVRLKPLTRQTSVQEGKEYEGDIAEVARSKANCKSEINYRDSYEITATQSRDLIPEIKVQTMNSQYDFESIENDRRNISSHVIGDCRGQLQEIITEIPVEEEAALQAQEMDRVVNTELLQQGITAAHHDHTDAGNELIHSIKMDLSSASTKAHRGHVQAPSIPSSQVRLRKAHAQANETGASKSHQRVSVDSLSEIPLPPSSMLMQRVSGTVFSASPPLPAPPADMLTDSEEIISPPPAYQKVQDDVFFVPSQGTHNMQGMQETSFGAATKFEAMRPIRKAPADIQSLTQSNKHKVRKPQIGAISRIPAVNSTQSPVKHGEIHTQGEMSSPQKSTRKVAPNPNPDQAVMNAKGMTPNNSRRDVRAQQVVKYKNIHDNRI